MVDDENGVPVSTGFSTTAIIFPCTCRVWQVCIRKRKYPASEDRVLFTGNRSFGCEPATVPGIAPSWPRCTRENVMSSQTTQAISKGYRKNSKNSSYIIEMERERLRLSLSSHQEHHEKSYQQMDRWDHQRGLYMSRQRQRGQGHSAWSQGIICVMGLQLSSGSTWHSASCVLKVVKSLPKFLSARYGQHCWWDVNIGSCSGRSTSSGSRTSSPTSIAYKICMQPLLRHP